MNEQGSKKEPLSDLAYDWVTIIQHKSEALRAYEKYMQDARQANSPECLELMRQIHEQDSNHVREATRHLVEVLQQGRMAGQGQASQGESQRMREGGTRSTGTTQGVGSQGEGGQRTQQGTRSTGMTQGMGNQGERMQEGGARQTGGGTQMGQGEGGRSMREGGTRQTESEQGQTSQASGRQGEQQRSQAQERDVGRGPGRTPRSG